MFTIATLIFIGLIAGVYFKVRKRLTKKRVVITSGRRIGKTNMMNTIIKHSDAVDYMYKEYRETQPKINKHIRKKVLCTSKYKKRFV